MAEVDSPPLFYLDSELLVGTVQQVSGAEAGHVLRSRRLGNGDQLVLTNGCGIRAVGSIIALDANRSFTVEVISSRKLPAPAVKVILAAAVPKGDRQGVLLGMATQLGMHAYIPLECEHSVVKFKSNMAQRWHRIVVSACKQSRQCHFPSIEMPTTLEALLERSGANRKLVVGDVGGDSIASLGLNRFDEITELVLLVGPEGGFNNTEIELIERSKVLKLKLGDQILRTETAAVSMLAAINQLSLF